jgi:hypothetical protein
MVFKVWVQTPNPVSSEEKHLRPILAVMPRRLHNWSYKNVTDFLKLNGFRFYKEVGGSHEAWVKRGNEKNSNRIVGINFTSGSYPVGTMKRMIRESGVGEDKWVKWDNS